MRARWVSMLVCLYIDGYEIDTWKNCIAYEAAILFTEVDAVKLERPYSDESKDADSDYPFPVEPSDQEPHKGYQYRSTAGHLESTQGEESLKSSNRLLSRIRFSFAL